MPDDRPGGVEIVVPETFGMTVAAPPSTKRSTLFEPLTEARLMVAEVPVKVNATPVPGQVSCLVAGFTLPRNW